MTTITARDFNQSSSEARAAANSGPVIITERGKPAHVLMSFDLYKKLSGSQEKIADLLSTPGDQDVEFEIPDFSAEFARPADLS